MAIESIGLARIILDTLEFDVKDEIDELEYENKMGTLYIRQRPDNLSVILMALIIEVETDIFDCLLELNSVMRIEFTGGKEMKIEDLSEEEIEDLLFPMASKATELLATLTGNVEVFPHIITFSLSDLELSLNEPIE